MWSLNKILKGKSLDVFVFRHHVRPYGKIGRTFSKFGRTMSDDRLLFPALRPVSCKQNLTGLSLHRFHEIRVLLLLGLQGCC